MTEIKFWEQDPLAEYDVVRTWRRVFHVTGAAPMRQQNAKHKQFTPRKITIEFTQREGRQPTITKVAVSGDFTQEEGTGQRVYGRNDIMLLPEWLLTHVESVVEPLTAPHLPLMQTEEA